MPLLAFPSDSCHLGFGWERLCLGGLARLSPRVPHCFSSRWTDAALPAQPKARCGRGRRWVWLAVPGDPVWGTGGDPPGPPAGRALGTLVLSPWSPSPSSWSPLWQTSHCFRRVVLVPRQSVMQRRFNLRLYQLPCY